MLPTYHMDGSAAIALSRALVAVALIETAFLGVGCGSSGTVQLELLAPADEALSPLGEQIAEVVLVRSAPGEPTERLIRDVSNGASSVDIGTIEAGDGMSLAVELRAPNQRLVGYGRAPVLDIAVGQSIDVPIFLRRPFVYVAGDTSVTSFDATGDASSADYIGAIETTGAPRSVATSPDGGHLVIITDDNGSFLLSQLSTSDHVTFAGSTAPLGLTPSDLAVSDDGRFAAVGHGGNGGGMSIVDLSASGESAVSLAELGNVTGVAIAPQSAGGERAFAIIDGNHDCAGGAASSIIALSLTDTSQSEMLIAPGEPISDAAVLADGSLALALPCTDQLARFDAGGAALEPLVLMDHVTTVAVSRDRVWSIGTKPSVDDAGAEYVLASVIPDNGEEPTMMALGTVQERVEIGAGEPGDQLSRLLSADEAAAFHLVALPGSDYVAALALATYDGGGLPPFVSNLDLTTWNYMLIDTATGAIVQRVRTQCLLETGGIGFDDWECSLLAGQDQSERAFIPVGIAALYGAR